MASEIFAGLSALKTAFDLAKGLKDINDTATRNAAVIDLQEKILAAQQAQSTLIERLGALEKELTNFETWSAEKERYELTQVDNGVFVYALKPGIKTGEPPHLLCTNCYQQNKKSLLQATQQLKGRHRVHVCPACKSEFIFGCVPRPPMPEANRYNPFTRR